MAALRSPSLLLLIVALAAGCAGTVRPETLQAWVGRPAIALEREWGPATRQVREGDLTILIYEEVERGQRQQQDFDSARPVSQLSRYEEPDARAQALFAITRVYVRSYLFWVNAEGSIVRSAIRNP